MNTIKKNILSACAGFLIFNDVHAQVLYSEKFENLTVANVGTDITGQTSGQGSWYTIAAAPSSATNWFQIQTEPNKGKVITIQSPIPPFQGNNSIQQRDIDLLINNRTTGNNVIKFEVDFYTGTKYTVPVTSSNILFGLTDRKDPVTSITKPIVAFNFFPDTGELRARCQSGINLSIINLGQNQQKLILPFNTWIKCAIYLDYPNKKVYYEVPSMGIVVADDFLKYDPDPNYFVKYTPKSIQVITAVEQLAATYKFDNFKLTALNNVPLSTAAILENKFNLYPNPATNLVNITSSEQLPVKQVAVYDLSGKLLHTQDFNNEAEIQLNVDALATGTYLVHLKTDQGIAVKKLIKK